MALLPPPPISETELSAYVDGEAAPERKDLIEAWLARNPPQAARVQAWRRQNQALRAAMGRLLRQAPPAAPPYGEAEAKVTLLRPDAQGSKPRRAPWDRRDLIALIAAGSFLGGAGVACLAGYLMG
jgi:anti-sigma factor RsiW